jgi:hypothetical protein
MTLEELEARILEPWPKEQRFVFIRDMISRCLQHRQRATGKGAAVDFDDLQIELWERLLYTNNPAYLNAFVATCSSEQLRALQMGIESIKRRNAFKLITGTRARNLPDR